MFKNLTKNLSDIFEKIKRTGVISETQLDESLREIRRALLQADVALPVIKSFVENIRSKASGAEVLKSISPGQMVVKIVNDELIKLLTPAEGSEKINLSSTPPANILVVGLQGSGKTTASAKLALQLKKQNKKVLLVSLDIYRPAAQEQLAILAKSIDVDSLAIEKGESPIQITNRAIKEGALSLYDVVIYDSAGRLHIDEEMIQEVSSVKEIVKPSETLLVVDSMIGQDAINVATTFHEKLDISGIVLSRIDGDSKGGAALSVTQSTGRPIKFLSTGEKPSDFEAFSPDRIASRILDMGDVVSLVEKAAEVIDKDEAEKAAKKMQKGQFDLNDYISQLKMMKKMGGVQGMMKMIPGISKMSDKIDPSRVNDKLLTHQEAIVLSMTNKERVKPSILNASRRKRIAAGSGTSIQQVNSLIKQHTQISGMMKKMQKAGPKSLMRGALGKFFS